MVNHLCVSWWKHDQKSVESKACILGWARMEPMMCDAIGV